ncbi:universal stress protein [Fulvivirga ulvae]|uniref:universal stress protein n=1 Tax=Fulvivirga ulvae TaxID=2904245 RepID=UPI001F3611AA|nr:universal stress protein [Fulvivirga ulvae]UII30931.1 universal stress protein [Fulvivirga ulvae]
MEPFKNLLVGLDTSKLDATLIEYASFLVDHSSAEKVQFVNIVRNLNVPSDVKKEFPNIVASAIQDRKDKIKEAVKANFKPKKKVKVTYLVKQGQAPMLLDIANKSQTDLIIIGQKKNFGWYRSNYNATGPTSQL